MSQILFIPGLLCTSAIFQSQFAAFEGVADCHVASTIEMESIEEMADAALAQMDGTFSVLGFSMGGYVALEVARRAPDRVEGLALVSTSARPDTPEKKQARAELVNLSKIGKFKGVTPRLLPRFFSEASLQDETKTSIVLKMGADIGQENFMRQQQAIMSRRDQRPYLPSFDKPSVVICGTKDILTPPEDSQEMASLLPQADLLLLDEIAHMSTLEAPDDVNNALRQWHARTQDKSV